ncbi:hypothetical protein CHLNCDRAFT_132896 [Chlorella variabilis]|uniref:Aldose 1-epimerase n=1 Tax=Chlorella variabilis TaxID=554065 RepID=E1Z1W5_CHLVA|nr:hypothetical protein CHLNCDRAFT_132896 [Chlorella variabilis]EFN59887.1 hypothetical protein CHLNCDRAFT_132896 [Chlorella variabilis]|eukprot:XP_005851989.1 hypothetical protein CHLNCDRAFT_132896 [Chlorella variabilis]
MEPADSDEGQGVRLSYRSKDGEEARRRRARRACRCAVPHARRRGFPGTVQVSVTYTLTPGNELITEMRATTDKATPLNLAQHSYFNLAGHGSGDVLDHQLTIHGDHYTPVDDVSIPTGDIAPVRGTPFDFTSPHTVGERIEDVPGVTPCPHA